MELKLPQLLDNLLIYYTFDNRDGQTIENVANPGTADATATNVNYVDGVEGVAVSLSDAHSLIQSSPDFQNILFNSSITLTWWGKGNFDSELDFLDSMENPTSDVKVETNVLNGNLKNMIEINASHVSAGVSQGTYIDNSKWNLFTITLQFNPEDSMPGYGSIKRIAYVNGEQKAYLGYGIFEEDPFKILDTLMFKGNGGGLVDEVRL